LPRAARRRVIAILPIIRSAASGPSTKTPNPVITLLMPIMAATATIIRMARQMAINTPRCTPVVGMVPAAGNTAMFAISPAGFACWLDHWSGATLRVDPGIPKRIG
jgi:hypothetical protein